MRRRVFLAAAVQGVCNLAGILVGVGYILMLFDMDTADPDVQEVFSWALVNGGPILNRYLDVLGESVSRYDGVVDKFIGDAVTAPFGAPLSPGDDASRAVRAALDMVAAVDRLNAELQAHGGPALDPGVGLHTGEVVAGNIGSSRQLQYTLVGDTAA